MSGPVAKRTLLDLYNVAYSRPTLAQEAVINEVAIMDSSVEPLSQEGFFAQQLFELVTNQEIGVGVPFVIPAYSVIGVPFTWDTLGSSQFVFFMMELDCGGVYKARKIGMHDLTADEAGFGTVDGLSFEALPDQFLVARIGMRGLTSLEKEIDDFLRQGRNAGSSRSTKQAGAFDDTTGKSGFYVVFDLNDNKHRTSSKTAGIERMALNAGLIREIVRPRFEEFCPDLLFEATAYKTKCLELRATVMSPDDPNRSIAHMQLVMSRTAYTNNDKFAAAMRGQFNRSDWGVISLLDFRRPNVAPWGREATFQGRMELMDAADAFMSFQRVFKGEAFADGMRLFRELALNTTDPLKNFHDVFIQFELEGVLCAYFREVTKLKGDFSKKYPTQPLVTQADCAALFQLYLADFVSAAMSLPGTPGGWEGAPHPIFYGPESFFLMVQNVPGHKNGSLPGTSLTPSRAASCHKHGLCMWYLAGQLNMTNKNGEKYECRESSEKHVALKTVKYAVVKGLMQDPQFMAHCKSLVVKAAIVAKVEAEKKRFA